VVPRILSLAPTPSRRTAVLIGALLALPVAGSAEESVPTPGPKRLLADSLGFSVNRLGLQNTLDLRWVWPLTRSRNALLSGAHVSLGATHTLTPSYTRLAAWVELSPLSVLDLRAGVEPAVYFGTFGSLLSFPGYDAPFGSHVLDARRDQARPGTGLRLYAAPTVKMKLGPLVVLGDAAFEWWRSSAAGPYYYEPARDTLLAVRGDRLLTLSSVLVHQKPIAGGGKLTYGLGYDLSYPFAAPGNRSQQVGLVASRQFAGRRFGLNAPSLGGRVAYYLGDPSRQGQLTAAAGLSLGIWR
jgi:hypothetical protein